MFENKFMVNLYVLALDKHFELFIPIDEKVGNIVKLIDNSLFNNFPKDKKFTLLNLYSGSIYKNNVLVRDTDIKNETKLILI